LEFHLLGQVEAFSRGRRVELGPPKTQLLLAVLLLEAGRVVPLDVLVRRVWDEEAPAKVAISVQASFSRLRRRLEQGDDEQVRLEHVPSVGYRLLVRHQDVDALAFTRAVIQGQAAADGGQHDEAIRLLRAAAAMMHGQPLAGLAGSWARAARAGLLERHRAATITRIGLELGRADPHAQVAELRELVGHQPLDEAAAALLMKALHLAGRTADALDVYRSTSRRLRRELGIDPHRALREVHQLVLRGEDTPPASLAHPAPDTPTAPHTLERDPPGFIGRRDDLDALEQQITAIADAGDTALCVIDGMPGVGKTTLALRLAHALGRQGPGGALQVHLRGHDPSQAPATAEAALSILLGMLGVDPAQWQRPATLDHMLALWRGHTRDRRLLLLLDDATSAEQIRPLIPSGNGSIVLVTTRRQLVDLTEAVHHTVTPMPSGDARRLFRAAAKSTEDDDAVENVLAACGHLPLALSVAGGVLRMHPSWTAGDLADRLTDALVSDDDDTVGQRLLLTFETSYRDLPGPARTLLRRLALHPDNRITHPVAATLTDTDLVSARRTLDTLVAHHLLTEPQRHHYRLHDLLRAYATYVLARDEPPDERDLASQRLSRLTLAATERATRLFHPYRHINLALDTTSRPPPATPSFATVADAAAWLDQEQQSLRALALYWHEHGQSRNAAALARMLAMFFDRRSLWRESVALHENALRTWTRLDHTLGQAHALTDLTTARWRLGELDQALFYGQTALSLWRGLGDLGGEADAHLQLGRIHRHAHRLPEAADHYRRSVALRAELHDTHGEATSLYHLGIVLAETADYDEAIARTERALSLARTIRDEAVERATTNNLGDFLQRTGQYERAISYFHQALAISEHLRDPRHIALIQANLGETHLLLAQHDAAFATLRPALLAFKALGDRLGEANALIALGTASLNLHATEQGATYLDEAEQIAQDTNEPTLLAKAHLARARLHTESGNHRAALSCLRAALSNSQRAREPLLEAKAHHGLGDTLAALHRHQSAQRHHQYALRLYEQLKNPDADTVRALLHQPAPQARDGRQTPPSARAAPTAPYGRRRP
jgi:DNA-binding SARP family transcriptional activator/tetratricopeptide (TPR) repeat protein